MILCLAHLNKTQNQVTKCTLILILQKENLPIMICTFHILL